MPPERQYGAASDPDSNDSSPMSLTHQDQMSDRGGRASPVSRRKQARPRRLSVDRANSSLDLSEAGSPPLGPYTKSPNSIGAEGSGPQNLSTRRSHSPGHAPTINLVKMEQLVEDRDRRMEDNISYWSLERDRDCDSKPPHEAGMSRPALSNSSLHHLQKQEAPQALNFMASGGGLPYPLHSPPHHSSLYPGFPGMPPMSRASAPNTLGSAPAYFGRSSKGQHSAPRGGPPRSWTNDNLIKALENIWNKRMTTSQASKVFRIPYNSLLMYVLGRYGKSLRLDILKRSTPAANDNLNTIGNSRSTQKDYKNEYGPYLAEVRKERNRKPSPERPGMPMFPFDPPSLVNPFSNGLLQSPGGLNPQEPFGLLGLTGLPPADSQIKDLM